MKIFEDDASEKAMETIRQFCLERKYKIAAAESVTSGLIQLMLSCCTNAGLFFVGGTTAYSCTQKEEQFGISYEQCEISNGVSPELSEQLALQICKKFKSDLGLGITGFASPIPEKGIFELHAYGSFCFRDSIIFTKKIIPHDMNKSPLDLQREYASNLIKLCSENLGQL
jgi:nicotinamide-nucleotide amidase